MGGKASKESVVMNSTKSDAKNVTLLCEICSSWGYGNKVSDVKTFITEMNNQGYNVTCTFEPQSGGKGEFFVYQVLDGQNKIIYSNNQKHSDNAVIGRSLKKSIYNDVLAKIKA